MKIARMRPFSVPAKPEKNGMREIPITGQATKAIAVIAARR
jgi:hypothetical protein